MKIIGLFILNMKVEIKTCTQAGISIFISIIILDSGKFSTLPFISYRKELLIVMTLAMTINQSKG